MKRHIFVTIHLVTILIISSYAAYADGFTLPGFQGYVLDKESGKPIENAYVVCFTDYYSFGQQINPGGGNAHPDELQVAITDKKGFFKINPYRRYSGGWAETRNVYIFKEGYIYALQYFQSSEKKNVLCRGCDILNRCCEETPLKGSMKIYLSNKENINIYDAPLSNGYLGLLYNTSYYRDYFKNSNKVAYKKYKPFFLYLYKIADKYSGDILKTFSDPNAVHNWENNLSRYRDSLRLKSISKEGDK